MIKNLKSTVNLKHTIAAILLANTSLFASSAMALSPALGDDSCGSLLLVSSWTKNNVKIYDGCSGEYIRDLDSQNLINGPLGLLEAPDGDLLVISESNNRLLKFDRQTLSQGSVIMGSSSVTGEVEHPFISAPSGAVIDDDGFMYAASYGSNNVVKIDTQDWRIVDEILPPNNGLVRGIDAGIMLSDDGYLLLPGYDSDNIIKVNLTTKEASVVVVAKTAGLDAPRTIMQRGGELVVTAERSNAVMVFDYASGEFKETLVELVRPTGMQQDGDDHFLVNNSMSVFRLTNDGSSFERPIQSGAGGLEGGTFIYRLHKIGFGDDGGGQSNEGNINITGNPITSINQDANYSFTPDIEYAGDMSTVSFSINNKPQWADFSQGTGELSGAPGNSDVGSTTNIVITANVGSTNTAMNGFDLTVVNVNDTPVLSGVIPQQSLTLGGSLSVNLSDYFNDIDSTDSLAFSAEGLPEGVALSDDGVISGSPTVIGTSQVTVIATDTSGASVSGQFAVDVQNQSTATPAPAPTPAQSANNGGGGGSTGGLLLILALLTLGRRVSAQQ